MLYQLLTLLLPYRATPFEMEFHIQFVLRAYRDYYERLAATGLRDRKVLSKIKNQTAYSMTFLFWRRPLLWLHVCRFHRRLLKLKKSVLPLDEVPKLLDFSVIDRHESVG
jgi:hypothetical protein